jgi:hypothetical protein
MYERLDNGLDDNGTVIIRMTSGAKHELHLHNTRFVDDPWVKVDGDDEIY